jgi:hypothetical protein
VDRAIIVALPPSFGRRMDHQRVGHVPYVPLWPRVL